MYSDPMPGENYENAAEREKSEAERKAIENGESFNPYSDDGFNSLEGEVPFAGEQEQGQEQEEDKDNLGVSAGAQEDNPYSDTKNTVVGKTIAQDFENGIPTDLEARKNEVDANYLKDTTKEIFNDPAALGAAEHAINTASTNEEDALTSNGNAVEKDSKPEDNAVVASEFAIGVDSVVDDFAEKAKTGDEAVMAEGGDIEAKLADTQRAIDSIDAAVDTNGDNQDAMLAMNLKAQAQEMKDAAEEKYEEAKSAYDSMDDEQLAEAQEAEKKAEENGTSFDEELKKLEETQKQLEEDEKNMQANIQNDIAAGIFG